MDIIDRQVEAYNTRDIERFTACYASDIVIEDGEGNILMKGQSAMREMYKPLFETSPELCVRVVNRTSIGKYVIDEEEVTGINVEGLPSEMHVVMVYRVEEDKIVHARMYT
jgi:hypothetical protein